MIVIIATKSVFKKNKYYNVGLPTFKKNNSYGATFATKKIEREGKISSRQLK